MHCEWCGQQIDGPASLLRRYCSHRCEGAAMAHAAESVDALLNGEMPPERPTDDEIQELQRRAEEWTPERMQRRIEALENGSV